MLVSGDFCVTHTNVFVLICWCGCIFAYVGVSVFLPVSYNLICWLSFCWCCMKTLTGVVANAHVGGKRMLVSERALLTCWCVKYLVWCVSYCTCVCSSNERQRCCAYPLRVYILHVCTCTCNSLCPRKCMCIRIRMSIHIRVRICI